MEKNSAYLDFVKKQKGKNEMSDVLLARALVQDIGGQGRVSDMLYKAAKTLQRLFPHDEEPHKQWSERRLKGWWNRESENVMHWQMVELFEAARAKKEEQALIREARNEHQKFIAKTARIAALLEHQDSDFHRTQIEAMGQQSRGVGRSRDQGD